ncbi:MAG TPA: UDP-glucose/GDP-mannose dehydrogenase family protein [Candidatus Limnocylindrales bacterium]|jgi:GDP-mannose 6-dehydrogenase
MTSVSIFGLGYVGSVSAACFADRGHRVIGVDASPVKVDMIRSGRSPIIEDGLDELVAKGISSGRLEATDDWRRAIQETQLSIICVGTPSNANGSLDLSAVRRVAESIGTAIGEKDGYHVVVVRSTMLPGSTEEVVIPTLERCSGKKAGVDFGVCFNPEFLREGSSIRDFDKPPYTIIGGSEERATNAVRELYAELDAPLFTVPIRVAEMLKYANNAFHALKVAFANEIGLLCQAQGIDSHQVMDIFVQDQKLNISPYYLRPGFAFGGSCLPKDLRALLHHGRSLDVYPPVLEAILPSNERHVDAAYQMIRRTGSKRVGVLGLSFKAGTDDLRESPIVTLVERLIGRGYHVRVYDRNVSLANLVGANRAYIEQEIPHIASVMTTSLQELMDDVDVLVIANGDPEFRTALDGRKAGQQVIDLVRIEKDGRPNDPAYQGIAW